jgi:predicted outer membrane repeat protein
VNNSGGSGGGAVNAGTLTVNNCTFSGNQSTGHGGALRNTGTMTLTNSTFYNNTSVNSGAISSFVNSGPAATLTLTNCTVSGNRATDATSTGGGLLNGNLSTATVANTIVANNTAGTAPDVSGSFSSSGNNLIGVVAGSNGFGTSKGDQVNVPAGLDTLKDNGGPTDTMALLAGSLAINNGNNANAPATDQRGFGRNGTSDVGAFESSGIVPPAVPLVSVVSRKTHTGVGPFDVNLPGVESRSGGASGVHTLIFTFTNPLSSVGTGGLSSGVGNISSSGIGADAHQYIINLSDAPNAQSIALSLGNLTDSLGNHSDALGVSMGLLLGDANGDGFVNSGDATITRNRSGQATDATNFRADYNTDGSVNSADATIVRARSGQFLP